MPKISDRAFMWAGLTFCVLGALLNGFLGVRSLNGAEAVGGVVLGTFNLGVAVFLAVVGGRLIADWLWD